MIKLRNPEFGNNLQINTYGEIRHTINGDLRINRPPEWPYSTQITVSIKGLSKDQRDSAFQYFLDNQGMPIFYTDHNGREWEGIVISPEIQSAAEGRGCNYTLVFSLEGTPVG